MADYPNQYDVAALPYTRDGTLNRSNPDLLHPPIGQRAWPGGEHEYILTTTPGQAYTIAFELLSGPATWMPIVAILDATGSVWYEDWYYEGAGQNSGSFSWTAPVGVTYARVCLGWDNGELDADYSYRITITAGAAPGGARARYRVMR